MFALLGLLGLMAAGYALSPILDFGRAAPEEDDDPLPKPDDEPATAGGDLLDEDDPIEITTPAPLDPLQGILAWAAKGGEVLQGSALNDYLLGDDGDDRLEGGAGDDELLGGNGNDVLIGGDGDDKLYGGAGDDILLGEAGDDLLHGGDGDDYLHGGSGDDVLHGGPGDDILVGGLGSDTLFGGAGNDILDGREPAGQATRDWLNGGAGDDRLYLGALDIGHGGTGADTFVLTAAQGAEGFAEVQDYISDDDLIEVLYDGDTPPVLTTAAGQGGVMLLADGVALAFFEGQADLPLERIVLTRAADDITDTSGTEWLQRWADRQADKQSATQNPSPDS
ncbi:calcium-binding protein [Ketogulonicigenium vulgare]|uniref:calcium-binding protein n=1 Tax=Ketogulonicigenium vulgare TaxID=92945 RepID=UPI002359FC2F|nr:calcium-binding protein [Ketogulonicigenium vulgare]